MPGVSAEGQLKEASAYGLVVTSSDQHNLPFACTAKRTASAFSVGNQSHHALCQQQG